MKSNQASETISTYLKIVVLSVLVLLSFLIAKPFLLLILWSLVVAVALYPLYKKIVDKFPEKRRGLASTGFILILVAIIIVPIVNLTTSTVETSKEFSTKFQEGTIKVNPPDASVKEWPLVGSKVHGLWTKASNDLESFIRDYPDQVKSTVGWFFDSFTGLMGSLLLSIVALIIAGVFMSSAESGYKSGVLLANKLNEGHGEGIINMCRNTIRSVVKGILLVAIIQAVLAFIGFSTIGIGAAGVLAFVVMFCAIIQIPVTLVVLPVIIYVFSFAETTPAIVFTIYIIVVSLLDNFLKPLLLAKGLETPMIIILIGAIGGMMLFGILGLFLGPVILAIGHKLYTAWVNNTLDTI